jgi:histidinol-phosphate/aromatic aminotransferase/cobyric acid decarboxylase-like protein
LGVRALALDKARASSPHLIARVRKSLERISRYPEAAHHEARERVSDLVCLTARLRRLKERLSGLQVAEVSDYLAEMLRVAANVREGNSFRKAAGCQ